MIATGFEKVPFPPRASTADRPASLPSQAAYVPHSAYSAATYQPQQPMNSYTRYDSGYTPVGTPYTPVQGSTPAGEPEVPLFGNDQPAAAPQRVSPFAAMPETNAPAAAQERQEERGPRSFMDGIPAYMRRK